MDGEAAVKNKGHKVDSSNTRLQPMAVPADKPVRLRGEVEPWADPLQHKGRDSPLPVQPPSVPPRPAQIPAMRSFYNQVQRMKLDVATVAPVHGKPVPWSTFMTALGPAAKTN